MTKRDMFTELMQGLGELKDERESKITLRSSEIEEKPRVEISAAEIIELRSQLGISRPILAKLLRMSPRTIERWEQDKAKPDQGSATLLKLVSRYPDTLEKIASL
ncbi:MAG: transcriptional regulator [Pseudomonadales bacterium]|nr:transcriptional regulator [Pseudomonadales bacterium]